MKLIDPSSNESALLRLGRGIDECGARVTHSPIIYKLHFTSRQDASESVGWVKQIAVN